MADCMLLRTCKILPDTYLKHVLNYNHLSNISQIIKTYNSFLSYNNVHNLYFDSNSIIYDCLRELINIEYIHNTNKFENELIKMVCEKLVSYINIINPSDNVIIAFDGVAPVAKMEQQRSRRFKTHFEKNIIKNFVDKPEHFWDKTCRVAKKKKYNFIFLKKTTPLPIL